MKRIRMYASARHYRRRTATAVVVFTLALMGCARSPPPEMGPIRAAVIPPMGRFYTHFHAPLMLPGAADLGDVKTPTRGPAVYVRIPLPSVPAPVALEFALGRVDIESAARRSGVEQLVYADYEFRSILGYFKTMTVHVHGFGPVPPEDSCGLR